MHTKKILKHHRDNSLRHNSILWSFMTMHDCPQHYNNVTRTIMYINSSHGYTQSVLLYVFMLNVCLLNKLYQISYFCIDDVMGERESIFILLW